MDRQRRNRRHEVLGFVHRFIVENGYAPTCAEIGKAVGLSGKSHASYYLGILEREGHIQRTPRSPRGLRLLQGCGDLAARQPFDAWSPDVVCGASRHPGPSEPEPAFLPLSLPGKGNDHDA